MKKARHRALTHLLLIRTLSNKSAVEMKKARHRALTLLTRYYTIHLFHVEMKKARHRALTPLLTERAFLRSSRRNEKSPS